MKQGLIIESFEKFLDLSLAVFDDMDFFRDHKAPQVHEPVDGRVHRKKIGIYDRDCNFPNMRASASAKKCRLRVPKIFAREIRLTFKNGCDSHRVQICLSNGLPSCEP